MKRLEVSGAVRPIYGSLGVKRLSTTPLKMYMIGGIVPPIPNLKSRWG